MEETWKTVAGFHGKYFVSSIGRVKNKNGLIIRQRIQKSGAAMLLLIYGTTQKDIASESID